MLLGLFLFAGALYSQYVVVPTAPDQYLSLTPDQALKVGELNQTYAQFSQQKNERAATVNAELSQETAKETLDPMALGLRYLELEAIHRALASEKAGTVKKVQALLTAEQLAKVGALNNALKLYLTACGAVSSRFLVNPNNEGLRPAFVDGNYGLLYPDDCNTASGPEVFIINSEKTQIAGMAPFSRLVQTFLALTDDQIHDIEALQSAYVSLTSEKESRQYELKSEIVTETLKEVMDPMALGVRYAELETIRRELVSQRNDTVAAAQKVLDSTQAAKLATLDSALKLQIVACSAASEYLLTAPEYAVMRIGDFSSAVVTGSTSACSGGVVRMATPIHSTFPATTGASASVVR